MSSTKIILLAICLLFGLTASLNLVPDQQNPIQMVSPTSYIGGQSIVFRFSLPTGSSGLNYGQYIGVTFPASANTDLAFNDATDSPRWSCALTDGTNSIELTAEKGKGSPGVSTLTAEPNVAYCRLSDRTRSFLKAGVNYKFTIILTSTIKLANSYFLRSIGLFTASGNNPERVIIDSLPTYGTLGYYGDWTGYTPKPLEITTATTVVTSGPSASAGTTIVFPFNSFDTLVNLKVNSFISAADVYIVFKYPSSIVSAASSITTDKISANSALEAALGGALTLTTFGTDSLIVGGITENLIPGRSFQLALKGWKALDVPTTSNLNLELIVYYKNTYSVFSYSTNPIFVINKASLSAIEIKHPEGWDIWRNGAWPLRFTFTPNTELTKGGYVLIQHSDAKDGNKKLSFIASSCDFSENTDSSFDNSFGKRPNCYPLRLDHNYPNASTANSYNGSGIFFYAKSLTNKAYVVTVWAFADNCGGTVNTDANYTAAGGATITYKGSVSPYDPVNNLANVSVTFNFVITIYKGINTIGKNEDRFTTQTILAQSSSTAMTGKCYNNLIQGTPSTSPALRFDTINFLAGITDNTAGSGADLMLFKEINDWQITSQTGATACTGTCWATDISGAFTEAYIYSTLSPITTNSYFLMKFNVPLAITDSLLNYLALPAKSGTQLLGNGKYQWIFPKQWFIAGDPLTVTNGSGCYLSWAYNDNSNTPKKKQKNLLYSSIVTKTQTTDVGSNDWSNNFITATGKTKATIDITLTQLTATQLKIVSTEANPQVNLAADIADFSFYDFISNPASAATANIGFFTSCIKWISPMPLTKSLYTYIDIQWQFLSTKLANNTSLVTKNNRFIKLFPEGGVFQDITKGTTNAFFATGNNSPYIIHFAFGNDAVTNGVCLIELDGPTIAQMSDGLTNSLVIWIYHGVLIETDYSDVSATYPVAPLANNVMGYGLQSAAAQSIENQYVNHSDDGTAGWKNVAIENLIGQVTPSVTNGGNTLIGNMRTHYHFTMGSVLILNGVSGSSITSSTAVASAQPSLLFPIYCPLQSSTSKVYKGYALGTSIYTLPTIMAAWISLTSHSSIGSLNRPIGTKTGAGMHAVMVSQTLKTGPTKLVYNAPQIATLRFKQYTTTTAADNTAENTLYVINAIQKDTTTATTAVTCTGHVLLINSSIITDATVTFNPFTNPNNGFYTVTGTKGFYVMGKLFHKAVFTGIGGITGYSNVISTNMLGGQITDSTSTIAYTGVKRPTVDTLNASSPFNLLDKLGYFCTPYQDVIAQSLQNYVNDINNNNGTNNFIVDWNPATSITWGTTTINADKSEAMYKGDNAGNVKLIVTPPTTIPAGANLVIKAAGTITTNTICGLVTTAGGIVKNCDNTNLTITCTSNTSATSFTVCCYNISITDTFQLSGLSVNFPNPTGITGISGYVSSNMYTATTTAMNWSTNSSGGTDVLGALSSKITAVVYTHVNQDSGIGKAIFTISLAREPVRDMKLTIAGDYSTMMVQGNAPRCVASFTVGNSATSFGSSWDNGDFLIDTCSTNGFANSTSSIVITTKKMVYKCGLGFSKTLYIMLWPVITVNWTVAPLSTNSYKITTTLNDGSTAVALNTPTFNLTTNLLQSAKPSFISQWDTLCAVSSITPRIPGEYADYIFDFDLDTNKKSIETASPNEVTIFFPYQYYGSWVNNVVCYYNGSLNNCSFTDEGILNIRFTQALAIGSGKKISVTVVGIWNPSIEGDYSFPCTVNQTNFGTTERKNLITGSGKLTGGITISALAANMGALRFLAPATRLTDNNPRGTSVHNFRVALDAATGLTIITSAITNSPRFIITFPEEYHLAWYTNKVSATIDEYVNDAANSIKLNQTLSSLTTTQSGNRVMIALGTSYTLPTNFRYWDIKISGVIGPIDTSVVTPAKTTGAYKVTLTNSSYSSIYRTYSNLDSSATDALTTAADPWLSFNRGNKFEFDNKLWVIDLNTSGVLNNITIKPGRFFATSFTIKSNTSSSIAPSYTSVSLSDTVFKFDVDSLELSTSYNQAINFYMGVSCGTAPGNYLLYFTINENKTAFAPLAPVQIIIDNANAGQIFYQTPPNIPAAGSLWLGILLSEPNVDELTVAWLPGDNNKNSGTATLTDIKIPVGSITPTSNATTGLSPLRCTFSITDEAISNQQTFKTTNPNTCYKWIQNTITFTIQGNTAVIPNNAALTDKFTYVNSEKDATLAKNSVKFTYKGEYAPVYLYCALTCINDIYPTDTDIVNPTNSTLTSSPLLQFHSTVLSKTDAYDFIFSGLVRGQSYKLRCIIKSTQGEESKRTSSQVNFETFAFTNTTVPIKTQIPSPITCVDYLFDNEPGQTTKIALVNYCQRLFSASGLWNNGCVICTDSQITYLPPGLSFQDTNTTTCVEATTTSLRFLQGTSADTTFTGTTADTTSTGTSITGITTTSNSNTGTTTAAEIINSSNVILNKAVLYSVCAVPEPVCATDITGLKTFNNYIEQLTTDLNTNDKFKTVLSISNVQVRNVTSRNDLTAPQLDTTSFVVTDLQNKFINGIVSFLISTANPLLCYWQIAPTATAPTFNALVACTTELCGKTRINTAPLAVSATTKTPLAYETDYYIYIGCIKDMPYAKSRSNVQQVSKFTTITKPLPTPSPNEPDVGSTYFNCGFISILIALALIFN